MAIDIMQGGGDVSTVAASLKILRAASMLSLMPWLYWALAVGLARTARTKEALRILDEAIAAAGEAQNMWWSPELLRTKGEILAQGRGGDAEAGVQLREARSMARRHSATLLEVRAATACVCS